MPHHRSAQEPPLSFKALTHEGIMCETEGCERPAEYLFRLHQRMWAECDAHARATASRHSLKLPLQEMAVATQV